MDVRSGWRRTTLFTLAIVSTLILGTVLAPDAAAGYRGRVLRMVNATRQSHHLHRVSIDRSLSRKAMHHTRRMIGSNSIYDPPNLSQLMSGEPWTSVGASNVGCGQTLRAIQRAFMHSSAHRANILNGDVRRIGIGVVKVNAGNACGRHSFWETQLFYG